MNRKKVLANRISYIKPFDSAVLIIVFIMFIALIIGVSLGTQSYRESQLVLVQDSMDILADNQRVQLENYISDKVSLLEELVTFPEIYEMDSAKQREFIKGRFRDLGFHHLFIMSKSGMGYYIEESVTHNQKGEPFFEDVMENEIFITEPFYGADATTMTISVWIHNKSGDKVGALCGAIELKDIQQMFAENRMFLNGENYLINRDGRYMSANDMQKVYQKGVIYDERDSEVSLIREAFEECDDKIGTIIQNGVEYQTNVTYLKDFDWVIVQCVETEEIFKGLRYIDYWCFVALAIVLIIIVCVGRITVYWHRSNRKINTDTLTKCRSRAAMHNLLEKLEHIYKYDVAVIYLDLNHFKQVNDNFGHDSGDKILCIFSDVLTEVFGRTGQVGRIGGDEFMVVLLNTSMEEIESLCGLVEQRLETRSRELEFPCTISTSYGYAIREKGSITPLNDIVTQADENMYRHKENTR